MTEDPSFDIVDAWLTDAPYSLTDCERFFAEPSTTRQRQYEALRAFYLERLPSAEVARRFGYSAGAFELSGSYATPFACATCRNSSLSRDGAHVSNPRKAAPTTRS